MRRPGLNHIYTHGGATTALLLLHSYDTHQREEAAMRRWWGDWTPTAGVMVIMALVLSQPGRARNNDTGKHASCTGGGDEQEEDISWGMIQKLYDDATTCVVFALSLSIYTAALLSLYSHHDHDTGVHPTPFLPCRIICCTCLSWLCSFYIHTFTYIHTCDRKHPIIVSASERVYKRERTDSHKNQQTCAETVLDVYGQQTMHGSVVRSYQSQQSDHSSGHPVR